MNAEDESKIIAKPLIGTTPLAAFKLWEECIWVLCCHPFTLARGCQKKEVAI